MTSPPSAHPQPVTNDDLDAIERAVTESLWRAKSYADLGVEEPSDAYTDATLDEIDNVLVPAVMESVTPLIDEIRTLRAAIRDYIDGAVPDDDPALCPHCGAGDCYSDATGTIRCTQVNRAVFLDEDGRYRHLRKHLPDTAKWSALGGGE